MLVLIDLFELEVIVAPKLSVASSHRVGGFQQIAAEETIAGLNKLRVLCLEVARLVPGPDETSELGHGRLGLNPMDVAALGDDTDRIDLTNARNGCKRIGVYFELMPNSLVLHFDLAVQRPHGGDRNRHGLNGGIIHGLGQAVRTFSRCLHRFYGGFWIGKAASASFGNKCSQLVQVSAGQLIHRFKAFHEG